MNVRKKQKKNLGIFFFFLLKSRVNFTGVVSILFFAGYFTTIAFKYSLFCVILHILYVQTMFCASLENANRKKTKTTKKYRETCLFEKSVPLWNLKLTLKATCLWARNNSLLLVHLFTPHKLRKLWNCLFSAGYSFAANPATLHNCFHTHTQVHSYSWCTHLNT